jgi:hypothetical protein
MSGARTILTACVAVFLTTSARPQVPAADLLRPAGTWSEYNFGNAPLPPMGWNSWNAFATQIDEFTRRWHADAAFALDAGVSGVKILELVAREVGVAHAPSVVTWGAAALQR